MSTSDYHRRRICRMKSNSSYSTSRFFTRPDLSFAAISAALCQKEHGFLLTCYTLYLKGTTAQWEYSILYMTYIIYDCARDRLQDAMTFMTGYVTFMCGRPIAWIYICRSRTLPVFKSWCGLGGCFES
jgi:hypothetical protein